MVIAVEPSELVDVICVMPGIWANCRLQRLRDRRRHGFGTGAGRLADTWMVGKSTCGNGATGNSG